MGTLSKSSEIAIQIAEYEAVRSRHMSIEPEHFLLGILSLEKVFDAGAQSQFQLNPDAVDSVRIEFEPLQSFLRAKGVNPPLMRRSLRELLRKYVSSKAGASRYRPTTVGQNPGSVCACGGRHGCDEVVRDPHRALPDRPDRGQDIRDTGAFAGVAVSVPRSWLRKSGHCERVGRLHTRFAS